MCKFYQANSSEDRQHVQELFLELAQFIFDNISQRFGVEFDVHALVAKWMSHLQEFFPPKGGLILAAVDSEVVGVGCLMSIGERAGQIKHFYVRPPYRRRGLGRKLLDNLVEQSVSMGHSVLRIDTGWFMEAAQALYRSVGFKDIAPYPETEAPKELHPFWIFLEKDLTAHT